MTKGMVVISAATLLSLGLAAQPCLAFTEVIPLTRAKRGAVAFTHENHTSSYGLRCERCHHHISKNPTDKTTCKGCHLARSHRGLCHECHLSSLQEDYAPRVAALAESLGTQRIPTLLEAFHALCRDCHAQMNRSEGRKAPYQCGGCHK